VQTLGWTSYGCGTNPTLTVGAGMDCRDQGANMCQIELYNTDVAGNVSSTPTRQFSIDWATPTITVSNPAASAWKNADFTVSVTNSDVGSGFGSCYYRVFSNGIQRLAWTSYACGGNPPDITVGSGVGNLCRNQGADMCEVDFYSVDVAGNISSTQTRTFGIDWTAPDNPYTVNGWDTASKTVSLTDGGGYTYLHPYFEWTPPIDNPVASSSGIAGYYVYFGTDSSFVPATFQVSASFTADANVCGSTHYLIIRTVDNAGNISAPVTVFTYIKQGTMNIVDNQSDDTTWHNAPGTLYDVDFGTTCEDVDRVQYTFWTAQNMGAGTGTQMLPWTTFLGPGLGAMSYTTDWAIRGVDFTSAAEGVNFVSVRALCTSGLTGTATDVFYFKKDTVSPSISTGALNESNNYMWISPSDNKLYYGTGMATPQSFTVSGTATDTTSGLNKMTFQLAFDDVPADDVTPATWSGAYDISSTNTTAATITVVLYDNAGNTSTGTYSTVHNNDLTIQYATMTPGYSPEYVKFNVYYPDGTTQMTSGYPSGLFATATAGVDLSNFINVYDKNLSYINTYDDAADAVNGSFLVESLAYKSNPADTCGGVNSFNAWCAKVTAEGCFTSGIKPHFIGIHAGNIQTNGFIANLTEETSISGDLGPAVVPPATLGDAGTFDSLAGPDYMKVNPQGDGILTEDVTIPSWCSGGSCNPACSGNYCSNATSNIKAIPDFVKRDTGSGAMLLTYATGTLAAGEWSWDGANNRIIVFDNPSAGVATMTATLNGQSEMVCVNIYDSCDNPITYGNWSNATVQLTLDPTQAPNSGMDITRNDATATYGFNNVTTPAAGFSAPNQTVVKGDMKNGKACITITAESVPNDTPATPIKVTAEYFGTPALGHYGGTDTPAFVLIRENTGVSSGTTSFGGISAVTSEFISTPDTATQSIVMTPEWAHDGSEIGFISRQLSPCTGLASLGETPNDNFNIYIMKQSGGTLSDCARLTRNGTDSINSYGVSSYSDITWNTGNSKIVFSARDMLNTGMNKLFWVDATVPVGSATGTQYNFVPSGPIQDSELLETSAVAGDGVITVSLNTSTAITVGENIVIYQVNPATFNVIQSEVRAVTSITPGAMTMDIGVSPVLSNSYTAGLSYVEYPVTLNRLGQYLTSLNDSSEWLDPNWSGDNAECYAENRDKLIAIRQSANATDDKICNPACSQDASSTSNANIVMFSGAKNADGVYVADGSTSNLSKITNFDGNAVWPLKPKWSPDCKMIAFVAWDRTPDNDFPTGPSKTSIYFINLAATNSGFATASLPITSLTDTGVYKVYDYASYTYPAFFPNWSADSKLVSYSVDKTNTLDILNMNAMNENVVELLFSGSNYDSYLEYILDQPDSQGAVYAPQIVGQVAYNEMGLAQCPNHATSTCPGSPNTPYVQVSQMSSGIGAYLRLLTMDNNTNVTNGGGILFQDGIVTAIFPPNVIASDTIFYNTDPTAFCGGAPPSAGCPVDPTTEYIVQAGEAREYFPDGTNFNSYVRLIFHYCDNDNDGKVDTGTEGIVSATAGGTKSYGFNPITGACAINGVSTSGGTIDIDTLAVYNWDRAGAKWVRMDGMVDRTSRTLTVFSSHFSRYDTFGFRTGFAPNVIVPLQLYDVHTYPNPYVASRDTGINFAATELVGSGPISVNISVYDIRGSLVNVITGVVNTDASYHCTKVNNACTLATWYPPVNSAGRHLASGVYLYYLTAQASDGTIATQKGKFSIIR